MKTALENIKNIDLTSRQTQLEREFPSLCSFKDRNLALLFFWGLCFLIHFRVLGANETALSGSVASDDIPGLNPVSIIQNSYAGSDSGFEGAGWLESYKDFSTTNPASLVPYATFQFKVAVKGNTWLVTTIDTVTNGQTLYQGCNGVDVYWMVDGPMLDSNTHRAKKVDANSGIVTEGIYPLNGMGLCQNLPWLAYCSSKYFAEQLPSGTGSMPAPWKLGLLDRDAGIYSARIDLLPGSFGLPLHIEYQPDTNLVQQALTNIGNEKEIAASARDDLVLKLSTYFSRIHEPESIFSVLQTTNFEGKTLPLEFQFKTFWFLGAKSKDRSIPMRRAQEYITRGHLSSVRTIEKLDPFPVPSQRNIAVADYRFYKDPNRIYFLRYKGEAWLTNKSDPQLISLYGEAIKKSRGRAIGLKLPKIIVASILVAVFFSPLAFKKVRFTVRAFIGKQFYKPWDSAV